MARNPYFIDSLGVSNFAKILPDFITSDPRFWPILVKTEVENTEVDLAEYHESLQGDQKKNPWSDGYRLQILA